MTALAPVQQSSALSFPQRGAPPVSSPLNRSQTGTVVSPQRFKSAIIFDHGQTAVLMRSDGTAWKREGGLEEAPDGQGQEVRVVHVPSGQTYHTRVKVEQFATPYIVQTNQQGSGSTSTFNGGFVGDVWYLASDVSALVRNIDFGVLQIENPDLGITGGLGFTSAGGIFTGSMISYAAYNAIERANRIGDIAGRSIAQIKLMRGVAETTSGAVMAGVRTVSLMGADSTSKTLAAAGHVLGITSTVASSVFFALLIAQFSMLGVEAYDFKCALEQSEDPYAFLKSQLEMSREDWEEAEKVCDFQNAGEFYAKIQETIELTNEEDAMLSQEDKRRIFAKIPLNYGSRYPYYEITDPRQVVAHFRVRLAKEVARMKMVKEETYLRKAGKESLDLLKANPATPEDIEKVVQVARGEARFNSVMAALVVFTCILGIASFILATVFSGGTFLILGLALMLVMNIQMTIADGAGLIQAARSLEKASWKDIAVLVSMVALTLLATTLGAYFAAGPIAMITVLAAGALMLGVQGAGIAWAYHKYKPEERPVPGPVPPVSISI